MKKIGIFCFAVLCFLYAYGVEAAETVHLDPAQIDLLPGETKSFSVLLDADAIVEGSITVVTTNRYISLVSVMVEAGITAENKNSTTRFESKKALTKGQKIGTITIKALPNAPIGTEGNISVSAIVLVDTKKNRVSGNPIVGNVKVVAEAKKSSDTSLKSLHSKSVEIPFEKEREEYTLKVPNEVQKLELEALATDEKASVKVSNQDLIEGENEIRVTVTAEDGTLKEYLLKVTREAKKDVVEKKESSMKYYLVLFGSLLIVVLDVIYIIKKKK